jgi:hypothetical protein
VVQLGGAGVPLPQPGCADGTPNTVFSVPLLLDVVCNANDSNGVQLRPPYGVREGLTAFVLAPLVKATTAASESRARAPGGDGDADGDGVPDDEDECPNRPGPASNDGCPAGGDDDRDGDGVPNSEDDCPGVAGPASNDGCPIDTDGDGVPDADDACPTVPGPASNDGCPLGVDTDGDGIPDDEDACPTVPGPVANDGCPFGGGPTGEGPDNLAFTGSDLLTLALIGFGVAGGGLALMALADRRRRPAA